MAVPILLDTDIGTDIDDAYALVLAAASPELDLRAVTVVNNDVLTRGKIARRILQMLGREDVAVALGEGGSLTPGVSRGWIGHEGRGIDLNDIDPERDFASDDVAAMIAKTAEGAHSEGNPLTIVTIGALTNLALAMERSPDAVRKAARIIAMASTFEGYGPENAHSEHNLACDPAAAHRVISFGLPVSFIGLNVTRQTRMGLRFVHELEQIGGPLAESLAGMHHVWFQHIRRDDSPMHDGLAVAAVFRPELLRTQAAQAEVDIDRAAMVFNPPGAGNAGACEVAVSVEADAYHTLLFRTIRDSARATGRTPNR